MYGCEVSQVSRSFEAKVQISLPYNFLSKNTLLFKSVGSLRLFKMFLKEVCYFNLGCIYLKNSIIKQLYCEQLFKFITVFYFTIF